MKILREIKCKYEIKYYHNLNNWLVTHYSSKYSIAFTKRALIDGMNANIMLILCNINDFF